MLKYLSTCGLLTCLVIVRGTNGTDTEIWGSKQLGQKFLAENGFKHVQLSTADGALEAAPAVSTCTMDFHLLATVTSLRLLNLFTWPCVFGSFRHYVFSRITSFANVQWYWCTAK